MLRCIEEINDKNKRFKAHFTNGKTTKFELYKEALKGFRYK